MPERILNKQKSPIKYLLAVNSRQLLTALAVAVLLGACTNKDAQETQSLTDTYWRNTKTGDWLIGFTEKHVIYDNAIWDIVAMTEQGDTYQMTVSTGEEERNVKVSPTKEGDLSPRSPPFGKLLEAGGQVMF